MRDFFSRKNDKYTVIIGCGRLGASLANTMSDGDGDVAIMDIDKNSFRKLSSSYGGLVFTGDGMDFADLEEAQIVSMMCWARIPTVFSMTWKPGCR